MERSELDGLDRDTLIARAEESGVKRARILTRPELIDELLVRSARESELPRVRGLFGRARDLLARVIERGLHLPDAAERLRGKSVPPPPDRSNAAPLPTVTLAEIYAAQGHRERAVSTLQDLLTREPEHGVARALLDRLEDAAYVGPRPRTLPPEDDEALKAAAPDEPPVATRAEASPEKPEPMGMLDDAPLPAKYDVDECVALPVDPETLFVYWEVRDRTRAHFEATRPGGVFALRVLVVSPGWDGPRSSVRDLDVGESLGDAYVRELPKGAVVRAAIGWRVGEDFAPIAHSPSLETPPGAPASSLADVLVRWTPRGAVPLGSNDGDAAGIERALGVQRTRAARERFGGSSELMIGPR